MFLLIFLAWKHEYNMFQIEQKMCICGTLGIELPCLPCMALCSLVWPYVALYDLMWPRTVLMLLFTAMNMCGLIRISMVLCVLLWTFMALYGLACPCMALYVLACPCMSLYVFFGLKKAFMFFYGRISSFLGVIDPNSFDLVSEKTYYYWIKAIYVHGIEGVPPLKFKECDSPPWKFFRVSPPWRKPLDGASVKTLP